MDASPFEEDLKERINQMIRIFKKMGLPDPTAQTLIDPITGYEIKGQVFIGPVYYQALKHQVKDKWHTRSIGSLEKNTRQPKQGRSKDGGLRVGEMEVWAMMSHKANDLLKERMITSSDDFHIPICKKCGSIPNYYQKSNSYSCKYCGVEGKDGFGFCNIPYTTNVFFKQLQAMGINPRLKVRDAPIELLDEEKVTKITDFYQGFSKDFKLDDIDGMIEDGSDE
jgi:DNA-directed RNA polymerase beta subunit